MSIDNLKACLARRGYQPVILAPDYEKLARQAFSGPIADMLAPPPPRMVLRLSDRAVSYDLQTLEAALQIEPDGVLQSILTEIAPGHQHVCCAQCQEPLLLARKTITVHMARGDGMGMPYLTGETRFMEAPEYRSVKDGPHSRTLAVCPGCQTVLSEKAVKEIEDS